MDDETRAAFDRIDRWFELSHQQHMELQSRVDRGFADVDRRFDDVDRRLGAMDGRIAGLEQELRALRDWVTSAIAELRSIVQQILVRLDRLERRAGDPLG
jgi:hypothetical protein